MRTDRFDFDVHVKVDYEGFRHLSVQLFFSLSKSALNANHKFVFTKPFLPELFMLNILPSSICGTSDKVIILGLWQSLILKLLYSNKAY